MIVVDIACSSRIEVIPEDCNQVVRVGWIRYGSVGPLAARCSERQVAVGADANLRLQISVERECERKVYFCDGLITQRQSGSDAADFDPVEFRTACMVAVDPDVSELVRSTCACACISPGFRSEVAFYRF